MTNSYLREYIRDMLCEGETPLTCMFDNNSEIFAEAVEMAKDLDIDIDNRELKFFGRHMDGSVAGAAWISINEGKFEFVIALDEYAPDRMYKDLIQDCLEEFDYQNMNKNLVLEVSVDNAEDLILFENMGMKILREYVGTTIMGIED